MQQEKSSPKFSFSHFQEILFSTFKKPRNRSRRLHLTQSLSNRLMHFPAVGTGLWRPPSMRSLLSNKQRRRTLAVIPQLPAPTRMIPDARWTLRTEGIAELAEKPASGRRPFRLPIDVLPKIGTEPVRNPVPVPPGQCTSIGTTCSPRARPARWCCRLSRDRIHCTPQQFCGTPPGKRRE